MNNKSIKMKTEIKKELISRLVELGEKPLKRQQYPIIKVLIPILESKHPDVCFTNLESPNVTDKPNGYKTSWSDIKKYSGLKSLDFEVDNVPKIVNKDGHEVNPVWNRAYKNPTIGSVIYHSWVNKQTLTYGMVAEMLGKL